MKKQKILSIIMTACILLSNTVSVFASDSRIQTVYTDTLQHMEHAEFGSEWNVLALARAEAGIDDIIKDTYFTNISNIMKKNQGILHDKKYTEYARVVLALTAAGKDVTNVGGYDLLAYLSDFDKVVWQGLNGPIFALLALDSHTYLPDTELRERYITHILAGQTENGSFTLSDHTEKIGDVDITAMAVQALSGYTSQERVKTAVERALVYLSEVQNQNGGYELYGEENAESAAQVLIALTSMHIDPLSDTRFIKNEKTVIDALMQYYTNGGFKHRLSDTEVNAIATEQSMCAMVSYERVTAGKPYLYDMNDVVITKGISKEPGFPEKSEFITVKPVIYTDRSFEDIDEASAKTEIIELAKREIINGVTQNTFEPDRTMTRAEFTAVIVKALGLPIDGSSIFTDVNMGDWYYPYVSSAVGFGIVRGVSDVEFAPQNTITRQEAAVMMARAGTLCGMDTVYEEDMIRDQLSQFDDYLTCAEWSSSAVAFCVSTGLISDDNISIYPTEMVTRNEIAFMVYHLLEQAGLL